MPKVTLTCSGCDKEESIDMSHFVTYGVPVGWRCLSGCTWNTRPKHFCSLICLHVWVKGEVVAVPK